ncbi:NADP-dependent oxidoreductase [Zavarzinia sp. CC-PAN008]|uniref:NADP-dependent oxidoreductase n=1 Tax=Zavarzinia sp. CC-PAN008 TaxID=3243332 RepID=UPI003F749B69
MTTTTRRWVLAERPSGMPKLSDFRLEEAPLREPKDGEFVVRLTHHSLDAGIRPSLSQDTYMAAVQIGKPVPSFGAGIVEASSHPGFPEGTRVAGNLGWASHVVANEKLVERLDPEIYRDDIPMSASIGVLGVSGLTAYFGLLRVGRLKDGDTVLVSTVGGPVGAAASQIARIKGHKVVGIAGSPAKVAYARDRLRLDACIDYRAEPSLRAAIARELPDGADLYFDNVGAETLDAAILNLRLGGRIAVSGQTAEYNAESPRGIKATTRFITHRLKMEGFVVYDFMRDWPAARAELAGWIRSGDLVYDEHMVDGLEHSAETFAGLYARDQVGRVLIRVS